MRPTVGTLFAGRDISTTVPFRVTRDADIEIREYEAADLLQAMEENVRRRRFGDVVRLEIGDGMTPDMRSMLSDKLEIEPDDLYAVRGPLGLSALMELYSLDRPDLKDAPFTPVLP